MITESYKFDWGVFGHDSDILASYRPSPEARTSFTENSSITHPVMELTPSARTRSRFKCTHPHKVSLEMVLKAGEVKCIVSWPRVGLGSTPFFGRESDLHLTRVQNCVTFRVKIMFPLKSTYLPTYLPTPYLPTTYLLSTYYLPTYLSACLWKETATLTRSLVYF